MCGIFGYSGKRNSIKAVHEGLKRLEYRGYDSWGIAYMDIENNIRMFKKVGSIGDYKDFNLEKESLTAIGHTRWATHGSVSEINSHPHFSTDEDFAVAQNGIVENYQELKRDLISKGYKFVSQTDTEVIVRLIEENLKSSLDLRDAVRKTFLQLEGRNTIIVLNKDKNIIAVRNGSPLILGTDETDIYFASDTLSFANYTEQVYFMEDYEMADYTNSNVTFYNVKTNEKLKKEVQKLDIKDSKVDKEGFNHYMMKEIVEQKHTIRAAVQYSQEELIPLINSINSAKRVFTVGAGTAGFAASQIAYFLREYAGILAIELKSYEMNSYRNIFTKNDVLIAVSQSGETADTIEAVEIAKKSGAKIASIVNMVGSSLTRISDFPFLSRTGPEICVASTKAFTAQISWGYLLAKSITGNYEDAKRRLLSLKDIFDNYVSDELFNEIKNLVEKIKFKEHFFILGKGQNYNIALEGSLKVKEITYKHFEGFPAGELKHGVISLIDKGTPVFCIVSNDKFKNDVLSAAAEVKSRGAYLIGIAKENNQLFDECIIVPDCNELDSIINIIPFQLISYFLGVRLERNPDKPRNLAKSVTVK